MKKLFIPMALLFVFACNSGEKKDDSVEVAKDINEEKTDTVKGGGKMEEDNEFVVKAASGGLMEVQLGEMATTRATSAEVKEFGRMMVRDHSRANEELKSLAGRKNITIPTTPGEDHMDHINNMRDKTGVNFDKDYMKLMVDDHEDDIDKFEDAAKNAKDPDIRAFAAKQVPILRGHLERARAVNDLLK